MATTLWVIGVLTAVVVGLMGGVMWVGSKLSKGYGKK